MFSAIFRDNIDVTISYFIIMLTAYLQRLTKYDKSVEQLFTIIFYNTTL